jgi:hypothetical protein
MKKFNYLFTLCAILFGSTTYAQNYWQSSDNTALAITQRATNFTNSLVIGSNSVHGDGLTALAQKNTGIGITALDNLKTGDANTAVGFNSLGANGTGIGNTAVGSASGYLVSSGSYNTIVGNQAGIVLTGGQKNTFIGSGAKSDSNASLRRVGIGQGVLVTADNTAVIGDSNVTNVYFGGMGTGEWDATLHATGITLENSETITNATDGTIAVTATTTTFSGNVTVSSDMRLKDNIYTLGNTISDILKLDGKSYTREGRKEIGLLAQDVELVSPELVSSDAKGMLSVNYQALSAILINGVKDQEARISKQEERIANLEILVQLLLNKE